MCMQRREEFKSLFSVLREPFIYLAFGWLLKENNIRFFEKDGVVYTELNQIMH